MRTSSLVMCLILSAVSSAQGHDYWMQPDSFFLTKGESSAVHLFVGDHFVSQSERPFQEKMTVKFQFVGGSASVDLKPASKDGQRPVGVITAERSGSHLVAMERGWSQIELEAAKFNNYLKHEGLGQILEQRRKAGEDNSAGRERYRRYLKALVQVGSKPDAAYKRRLGHRLEIVPQQDPSDGNLKRVAVSILFDGKPLANAHVAALSRSGKDVKTREARTDKDGQVQFELDRPGTWIFRLVHMQRCKKQSEIDWESFWAAYSFQRRP